MAYGEWIYIKIKSASLSRWRRKKKSIKALRECAEKSAFL